MMSLPLTVLRLRRKPEEDAKMPRLIKTERGVTICLILLLRLLEAGIGNDPEAFKWTLFIATAI
jgi:hypothetical protein